MRVHDVLEISRDEFRKSVEAGDKNARSKPRPGTEKAAGTVRPEAVSCSVMIHMLLRSGLFLFLFVGILLDESIWMDEPATLYELRLFLEGMMRDINVWVVSLVKGRTRI